MRDKTQQGRRRFMKTAAVAGGAATVALTARMETAGNGEALDNAETSTSRGYHLTPHIEEYYRLARD